MIVRSPLPPKVGELVLAWVDDKPVIGRLQSVAGRSATVVDSGGRGTLVAPWRGLQPAGSLAEQRVRGVKRFDPNQPRDPHTGEWIGTDFGTTERPLEDPAAPAAPEGLTAWEQDGRALYQKDLKNKSLLKPFHPPGKFAPGGDESVGMPGVPVSTAQGWSAAAYHEPVAYDAIQAAARNPQTLPDHLAHDTRPDGWRDPMFFDVHGHDFRRADPKAPAELIRERLHLHDAIVKHGTAPPPGLVRVTGMDYLPAATRRRLNKGEQVVIEEKGFLAGTHSPGDAEAIGESTLTKGDPAMWQITTGPAARALNSSTEEVDIDEWVFAPGTRIALQKGEQDSEGWDRYYASIIDPPLPVPA